MDNTNLYGIGIFLPHERKVAKYTKEDIVTAARVRLRDGAVTLDLVKNSSIARTYVAM